MNNRALQPRITRTPYEALFGFKVKVGLTTSYLPQGILQHMQSEDLEKVIKDSIKTTEQEDTDDPKDTAFSPYHYQPTIHDGGKQETDVQAVVTQEPPTFDKIVCCVCSGETTGANTCETGRNIHSICEHVLRDSEGEETEGYGTKVLCTLCFKIEKAVEGRRIEIEPRSPGRENEF